MKSGELRCPRCFHRDIVPSMPRGLKDEFMRARGRVPRHCRSCGKRFYVRTDISEKAGVAGAAPDNSGDL